nr:PREDICTED: uncharacterized protein LOC102350522 [Latimeria chalumnae]XP_014341461.1 PREDICTED: uncharacterized protein LOC102350522 [Latimeria chalumnae]XP_014341462.1 PREDICTED: uncharacterized protein LOC102350522 [Latimeria chalumnae]XP_014341463.1 PREDICTED: uncharacterized protein LOC102350522 [Latimeria chalumnae]XP_014341464.1 PREDICTED: uncharacterized protein LOC102350522 [Latimeria chalumnae]XP_014341465.1 PREDICTED: uncharacterized protein LOC102350522 [Latimeria chalumnae]XP_01|eukprot:XP_014341460.1 PREDICTED: uncharacterized protein LOC102350522 [Latimeria chalumnae]
MVLILRKLDPNLHSYLAQEDLLSFTFCHRWLLNFQLEFNYGEGQLLLKVLAISCLDVSRLELEQFAQLGLPRLLLRWVQEKLRKPIVTCLELFICVAILIKHREMLLQCRDPVELIDFVRRMQDNIDLISILMEVKPLCSSNTAVVLTRQQRPAAPRVPHGLCVLTKTGIVQWQCFPGTKEKRAHHSSHSPSVIEIYKLFIRSRSFSCSQPCQQKSRLIVSQPPSSHFLRRNTLID